MPRKADHTFSPGKPESVRHIPADKVDKDKFAEEWKADRDFKKKVKDERFAAIRARRKNQPGGSGGGISIKVESDKK